jgi:hypothetical protein
MINEFVQASAWILLPFVPGVATGIIAMAMAWSMIRRSEEEMDCENCEVVEMCRKMFGKYWPDKSDGGKGCEHPVEASLAAGAMENPETESLKRGAARTGEYVGREGDCEIVEQPLTPRHAADASGGDLQRRNLARCKGKAPCVETRRGNNQDGGNSAHRITANASPHGKLNFVQEELI